MTDPSSAEQFEASATGVLPASEEVRPSVWSIPMPYNGGVPYTLCYAISDDIGKLHLVDPGADLPGNRERLRSELARYGLRLAQLASVTVTHLHQDHSGLASWLSEISGLAVSMHAADVDDMEDGVADGRFSSDLEGLADRWGVPEIDLGRLRLERPIVPTPAIARVRRLVDGERLPVDGRELIVVHTPGHTRGHICLADPAERLLFSGDHVLPVINPPIGRGGRTANAVSDYLDSLDRVAAFDAWEVAPGHGFRLRTLARRRTQLRDHVARRAAEVVAALDVLESDQSVWSIASQLRWAGGWERLHGTRLQSALMQSGLFLEYVRSH